MRHPADAVQSPLVALVLRQGLVDVGGGTTKTLHEDVKDKFWSITGDANAGAQPSPNGKWIAFLSDRDGWDYGMGWYVKRDTAPGRCFVHDGAISGYRAFTAVLLPAADESKRVDVTVLTNSDDDDAADLGELALGAIDLALE